MYRFNFTDAHQNLTFDQWKSLNREKKNEFIEKKRLFRINRKKESDISGIDAYDINKNKLEDKYAKVISSLPDDENL